MKNFILMAASIAVVFTFSSIVKSDDSLLEVGAKQLKKEMYSSLYEKVALLERLRSKGPKYEAEYRKIAERVRQEKHIESLSIRERNRDDLCIGSPSSHYYLANRGGGGFKLNSFSDNNVASVKNRISELENFFPKIMDKFRLFESLNNTTIKLGQHIDKGETYLNKWLEYEERTNKIYEEITRELDNVNEIIAKAYTVTIQISGTLHDHDYFSPNEEKDYSKAYSINLKLGEEGTIYWKDEVDNEVELSAEPISIKLISANKVRGSVALVFSEGPLWTKDDSKSILGEFDSGSSQSVKLKNNGGDYATFVIKIDIK